METPPRTYESGPTLGLTDEEVVATLESVRRGLADLEAGRVRELDEVFKKFDAKDWT